VKIKYLSHSGFELKDGKTILIDPYFEGNALAVEYEGKPDLILVTHEHFDHFDPEFLKRFDVPVVCPTTCNPKRPEFISIGEKKNVMGIDIEMIAASHHQSKYPTGFVLDYGYKKIAHLGDTYIDGVQPLKGIDILFVPIGGHFTMNVDEAVKAVKTIMPKLVIPMHYDTFPEIKADPEEFKRKAEKEGFNVRTMKFGEEIEV
jgi:L-ascorbate metabolism protein UlaG (beta-lactamase superfamily)